MIATPRENVRRFKAKLAGLKRRRRFVNWRESSAFARELQGLLEDIKSGVDDPETGVELVASFYESDGAVFSHCDDSNGSIGDVFRQDAANLFVYYGSRCRDKNRLCDSIVRLNQVDDFGVRDSVIDRAGEYLPESAMRGLVDQFWILADKEKDQFQERHWIYGIEALARHLRDAPLFERARRTARPEISTAACVEIAQVYSESGDAQTALSWLERIPEAETFKAHERDSLLLDVYRQLGHRERLAEVAWRIFRANRSEDSLATLLLAIGEEKRERVIDDEARIILQTDGVTYSAASFLIRMGRMGDAESYLVGRADQVNGDFYSSLLPLAQAMEGGGRELAATVVYRALLDSILRRGRTNTYLHGVRYLKKLDALSGKIDDWQCVASHVSYLGSLKETHGRKSSFWSRYEA